MSPRPREAREATSEQMVAPPPQDLMAEQALLGAMLSNSGAIAVVRDRMTPDEFYRPSHGTIFAAMLEMHARGKPVDSITVAAELYEQGLLENVGGSDFIYALPDLCLVAANVAEYAAIVKEMARRRAGIATARRLEQAFAEGTSSQQKAAGLELISLLGLDAVISIDPDTDPKPALPAGLDGEARLP